MNRYQLSGYSIYDNQLVNTHGLTAREARSWLRSRTDLRDITIMDVDTRRRFRAGRVLAGEKA